MTTAHLRSPVRLGTGENAARTCEPLGFVISGSAVRARTPEQIATGRRMIDPFHPCREPLTCNDAQPANALLRAGVAA